MKLREAMGVTPRRKPGDKEFAAHDNPSTKLELSLSRTLKQLTAAEEQLRNDWATSVSAHEMTAREETVCSSLIKKLQALQWDFNIELRSIGMRRVDREDRAAKKTRKL